MHTENFHLNTAIGFSHSACNAFTAVEVRQNGYIFSFLKTGSIGFNNGSGELMSEYDRIFEKGLCAFKRMKVGTTNTYSFDLEKGFTCLLLWCIQFFVFQIKGFCTN